MARFVFIVQGEGRGHMSQAMAMHQFLERNGHQLVGVFLGKAPFRKVPSYFIDFFGDILNTFKSPGFIERPDRKGIIIWRSLFYNILRAGQYLKEIRSLKKEIINADPETVINFYDLPGSFVLRRLPGRMLKVVISHHFYLEHKDFKMPPGKLLHSLLLKWLNSVMQKGCDRIGALSFREGENEGKMHVVPPLIRDEIREMQRIPGDKDLGYLLHPGFLKEIITIARQDQAYGADIFLDWIPDREIPPNLELHLPDRKLFMEKMRSCRRLITTSGFDTIAEAAMLSIPVVAVPSRNHYEQLCNAADMQRSGFGIIADNFTVEILMKSHPYDNNAYLEWLKHSEKLHLRLIEK